MFMTTMMLPMLSPSTMLACAEASNGQGDPEKIKKAIIGSANRLYGIDVKGDGKLYIDPTGQDEFTKAVTEVAQENQGQKADIDKVIHKAATDLQDIQQLATESQQGNSKTDIKTITACIQL